MNTPESRMQESQFHSAGALAATSGSGGNIGLIELTADDLPAYCPNHRMPLWSSHPRVFLDVVNEREAMCPYCGTRIVLYGHGCGRLAGRALLHREAVERR